VNFQLGRVEHHWHAAAIARIAVAVITAAGVTVAATCGGPSAGPMPLGTGRIVPTGGDHPLGRVVLASTTTSLADSANPTIGLPNGVTVAVPPGWTISSSGATWVLLRNADQTAEMAASSGHANTPNISDESAFFMNQIISESGLTNVIQAAQPVQAVQGNHFNEALQVNFTADEQTNQGTQQVWGFSIALYNTSAQNSGVFWLAANSPDALQAATPDAEAMLGSML
jgi:hypothetical protein